MEIKSTPLKMACCLLSCMLDASPRARPIAQVSEKINLII